MTERNRISKLVIDSLSAKHAKPDNAINRLIDKLGSCLGNVQSTITPVLKAGGGFDKQALRALVFSSTMEQLSVFSKDELHNLLTIVLADRLMADIAANPSGNDKPDLLSGQ